MAGGYGSVGRPSNRETTLFFQARRGVSTPVPPRFRRWREGLMHTFDLCWRIAGGVTRKDPPAESEGRFQGKGGPACTIMLIADGWWRRPRGASLGAGFSGWPEAWAVSRLR